MSRSNSHLAIERRESFGKRREHVVLVPKARVQITVAEGEGSTNLGTNLGPGRVGVGPHPEARV